MRPLPDGGGTERDALSQYKRQTGKDHPAAVAPVECPSELSYLWEWFWQISTGRSVGGMGTLMPIPPSEIAAWCGLRRVQLHDWELEVIWALDLAFRKAMQPSGGA